MADPSSSAGASRQDIPRSLHDPVLSSVEEELEPGTADDFGGRASAAGGTEFRADADSPSTWWPRMQEQVSRYVSDQPGKAALMALGAGALAALALGRGLRNRRHRD